MTIHTPQADAESVIAFMLGVPEMRTRADFAKGFRERAEMTIETLLAILDELDGDPDLEPSNGRNAYLHADDAEADDDDEPSLGWTVHGADGRAMEPLLGPDLEHDEADREPSLGWNVPVNRSQAHLGGLHLWLIDGEIDAGEEAEEDRTNLEVFI